MPLHVADGIASCVSLVDEQSLPLSPSLGGIKGLSTRIWYYFSLPLFLSIGIL